MHQRQRGIAMDVFLKIADAINQDISAILSGALSGRRKTIPDR